MKMKTKNKTNKQKRKDLKTKQGHTIGHNEKIVELLDEELTDIVKVIKPARTSIIYQKVE